MKIINNPALVDLLGSKFHVREITYFSGLGKKEREIREMTRIDGVYWFVSIVYCSDMEPQIGLSEYSPNGDSAEYFDASALLFSAILGGPELSPQHFKPNGALAAVLGVP